MRLLLTGEGYAVRTATDADEALTMVRDFDPRLILMDVQLPGVDGLALTRHLKADPTTRDTIILGITAHAMTGDEQRVLAAGCNGYVAKPIDTRTFPGLVARYLGS